MSTYLKLFNNHESYDDFTKTDDFVKPNVSHCIAENEVHYNPIPHDYSKDYLTFEVVEGGTINIKATNANISKTISYKVNDGEWTELTTTTEEQNLGGTLNVGDKVLIKGNNSTYATSSYYNQFGGTAKVNVYGNIMSLINGDDFINNKTLTDNYTFKSLFSGYTNLLSAEKLVLPATTLADNCYSYMFQGCTSLVTVPELPATTLVNSCYSYMFQGCTSLVTVPELPATTLAERCYDSMFNGCTSLTTAPELPATTLAYYCYVGMFSDCTSLVIPPVLPSTTLAYGCYHSMFYNCSSLTTAPELPATTLVTLCYNSMFRGCTSLTAAPELPATKLVDNCYQYMFQGCTSLNYIKAMFTTKPSSSYTNYWVKDVAASGTFIKNSAATWTATGVNGIPKGWTVETASE